jgi:hypothetical protein
MSNSNWRGYRIAAWVGVALLAGAIVFTMIQGEWIATAPLVGFIAVAILFIKLEDRLPTLFDLLFVIAALINAGGWAFKWYNTIGPYDELAHGFTTFALTLACGYLVYRQMLTNFHGHRLLFVLTVTSFGIAIGALWEIAEWISDFFVASTVVESIDDIIDDLILDSLGASIAGAVSLWALHDHARAETTDNTSATRPDSESPPKTTAVSRQKLLR